MIIRKERSPEVSFQDWLESLHFFDQANMDIGEGELEPPEEDEDDIEPSFGQKLVDMSDNALADWYVNYKQSKGNQ